jgi:TolB-like protein/AraC-like DNA-binding protein/Tfp pilus assembly protein PilF
MIIMCGLQSKDQLFIEKLTEIVIRNLKNENFSANDLALEAGMSRSNIHRKLKALAGKDTSRFIREIRLRKAMEMLMNSSYSAAEIAYSTGFGSPAYFTKCFHDFYGYPPGEVRKKMVAGDPGQASDQGTILRRSKDGMSYRKLRILVSSGVVMIAVAVIMIILYLHQNRHKDLSIVVLPFKNLSDDTENQYFADGVMEDILNNLYYVSKLRVVSRTTSERYRAVSMTTGEIAGRVNARYVLEGSVRIFGDDVRISVQLIDAKSDKHLWSEKYDRKLTDIIGVQGEIALEIAERLQAVLSENEVKRMKVVPTENPEAYDYYLKGRFLLHKANSDQRADISAEGLASSLEYYEKAIEADPQFAEAYAGLSNAWYNLSAWGWYQPYSEGIRKTVGYFTKALAIDPGCAEAHAVRGIYLTYPESEFDESLKELQTSIRLNPNFSTARQWYAQVLMITGPIEEARAQIDRAIELEPYFWVIQNLNSWICYFEEKYEKGLEACQTARSLYPYSPDNTWLFILHYTKLGQGEKVVNELDGLLKHYPTSGIDAADIMKAYNDSGIKGIYSWLIELNLHRPVRVEGLNGHPFYISWWYAILGDRENAIYWLEQILQEEHIPHYYFNLITNNPDFDILRGDPRFRTVMEKAGLARYNKRAPG